jgi:hypothetical protein
MKDLMVMIGSVKLIKMESTLRGNQRRVRICSLMKRNQRCSLDLLRLKVAQESLEMIFMARRRESKRRSLPLCRKENYLIRHLLR